MKIALPDLEAMADFGMRIATQLRVGDVVELTGDLGAGKTTLARAIMRALGHEGEVPSPTFTILETYDGPDLRVPVVHADFYRLETPEEAYELGLDDYRDDAVLLAEWPDKVGGFGNDIQRLSIRLETADEGRLAIVDCGSDWVGRMP